MAEFQTLDLGRILQTAEAIKGMRNDSITDKLRQQYLSNQNAALEQDMVAKKQQQEITFGREKAAEVHNRLSRVLQNQDLKSYIQSSEPDLAQNLAKQGIDVLRTPDDVLRHKLQTVLDKAGAEAGIAPTTQLETLQGEGGSILQRDPTTGALKQVVAPQKPDYGAARLSEQQRHNRAVESKAGGQFVPLSAEEIAQVGLPPGTSAQRDTNTGKVDVLSKRDTTATLSQKDATTAKMKLNTVSLARQQLNNIRSRFEPLKNSMSAGPGGQGSLPTKEGRMFDRSVDQMRSTLTALTRVPGVGAMSDYETKLDQAKFPTRKEYEEVTQQQIDDLDNMLNAIETGYKDILGGGNAPQGGGGGAPQKGTIINHPSGAKIEILD